MQLNIYIPKEKGHILASLEKVAEATGRPKNEIVLEALELYLPKASRKSPGTFSLGRIKTTSRRDVYERRLNA